MSDKDNNTNERKVKTLAIRLDPELHTQLSVIAQLSGSTITGEIRAAIASHLEAKTANADLAGAAAEMLEEIERDAAIRREALAGLLNQSSEPTKPKPTRSSGRKGSATGGASATS